MKEKTPIIIAILSSIAILNAGYLTYSAYNIKNKLSTGAFCDLSKTLSCSTVFNYDFAWFFSIIPFPLIALIVYPIILLLSILWYLGKFANAHKYIFAMAIMGFAFNLWIIYNEYLISSYCLLCLICTLIIVIIGILTFLKLRENK